MTDTSGGAPQELHVTEVDGIPAVWADVPGPFTAGLLIRTGFADETLARRGHAHMLEHLALFGVGRPGEHSNGHVDATTMLLHTTGTGDEVAAFLAQVSRQLVDPPTDRLEDEKGVLRAEQSRRGTHAFSEMQVWRWGMRTYGLESADELGLAAMSADSVRAWSRRFVNRGNAALWFTGPPPAGLSLPLPDGTPVPPPDPRVGVLPSLPAYYRSQAPITAVHTLVERHWSGPALARIVNNRLVDDLRTTRAAAYSPQAGYQPLGAHVAALMVMSDAVEGHGDEVAARVLGILAELADPATGARAEEVEAHRAESLRGLAAGSANRPPSAAWELVHGKQPLSDDELRDGLAKLTPEAVSRAAARAGEHALAQVPVRAEVPDGWDAAPTSPAEPVSGRLHAHRDTDASMTVGPMGVTLRESGSALTVLHAETAALGVWDDGGRVMIGEDGIRLAIEPTMWRDGGAAVAVLDSAVSPEVVIPFGSRPPESVPKPPPWNVRVRRHPAWRMVVVMTLLIAGFGAVIGASATPDPVMQGGLLFGGIVMWFGGPLYGWVLSRRARRGS